MIRIQRVFVAIRLIALAKNVNPFMMKGERFVSFPKLRYWGWAYFLRLLHPLSRAGRPKPPRVMEGTTFKPPDRMTGIEKCQRLLKCLQLAPVARTLGHLPTTDFGISGR